MMLKLKNILESLQTLILNKMVTLKEYKEAEKTMLEYQKQIRHWGRLLTRYRNRERKRYKQEILDKK
jgi:hypothetical protein